MKFVSFVFIFLCYPRQCRHWNLIEERLGFDVVFLSASYGQMRNFTPDYVKGWTYVRTYARTILSEPKFLGCIDNQIFLPMVLRWARAPLWGSFEAISALHDDSFSCRHEKSGTETYSIWDAQISKFDAAQFRSITESASKLPFSCVSQSHIRYGFHIGARAIWLQV